jgi:hypothetical protein
MVEDIHLFHYNIHEHMEDENDQRLQENYILFFEHDAVNECCRLIATEKGIRAGASFSLKDII